MPSFGRRDQKVEALRAVPLFAKLSKRELGEIARRADEVGLDAGETLTVEGMVGRQLYFLARGTAVVRRSGRKIAELGDGDVIGEMSLLDGEPASATVTLTSPATLLVMTRSDFSALLDAAPGLARKLLVTMARRLREADKHIVC